MVVSRTTPLAPGLNRVVGRKTTLPILQHLHLSRESEGKIHVQGTNLDAFVTYTAKEALPGPVLVLSSTCCFCSRGRLRSTRIAP
ncbi:hypothetical protein SBV1_410067 [Verrucomicrobia bacterium]|nr:hypothetical protein SBV1_410067 [Verrucomicrobiota bacterium]